MKCPKCGEEATFDEKIRFILDMVELETIRTWGKTVVFERWIHFNCSMAETPNFVFYIEGEESKKQ